MEFVKKKKNKNRIEKGKNDFIGQYMHLKKTAEIKIGSFRLHNPFCLTASRANTWGYKCLCINWHHFKHDAPGARTRINIQKNKV